MIVTVGHNNISCNDADQYEKTIRELLSLESAEVWISMTGDRDECPCMSLLVNQNAATLNYYGDDESCYVSYSGDSKQGIVSFCDGQYEIDNSQVIDKESALTALMDYYRNNTRSDSIQWDQLY